MDPDLKAVTKIGELRIIKQNFRETQSRLQKLEITNKILLERITLLEKHAGIERKMQFPNVQDSSCDGE